MTAAAVIEEIKQLPHAEQSRVIQFAMELARRLELSAENRPLSPEELGALAKRMVDANDSAEADRLQAEIVRGFYGDEPHA